MKTLHRRCAGLDVHSDTVVACARLTARTKASHEVRRFSTATHDLLELAAWLAGQGVTHVAMEATGIYWKPIWHMLEGRFELVLANAAHIRNVPGRKSDVNDAVWISDLLAHGLIRASFVPPALIQELRDLTRTRTQLTRELARHVQRIQKTSYGRYGPVALAPLLRYVNQTLLAWALRKFKRLRAHKIRASQFLQKLSGQRAHLFVHWRPGMTGVFA